MNKNKCHPSLPCIGCHLTQREVWSPVWTFLSDTGLIWCQELPHFHQSPFVQHPHFQQSSFWTTPSLPTRLFLYNTLTSNKAHFVQHPHFQQSPFFTTPSLPTTPNLYNTFTSHITMFVKHPFVQLPSLQQPYSYNAKAYIAKVSEPIIGIFWGRGANIIHLFFYLFHLTRPLRQAKSWYWCVCLSVCMCVRLSPHL